MIVIQHLTKSFSAVTALKDISLTVNDGEFFGLLGPNGAGKSTLINLMVGYLDADAGEILIGGQKLTRESLATRRHIGVVPQSLALYDDLSAEANLEVFGSFFHIDPPTLRNRIKEQLAAVDLHDRRRDKVKTFSGGMKRRLNLVASLLHDPPLLLCDEPTVGVDPQSRNAIFDYLEQLNRSGKTIVYTTHYMEEAERLCSRIAIIDFGTIIVQGTLDELLEKTDIEESISITKSHQTIGRIDLFKRFGTVTESEDRFELSPGTRFKLSEFYGCIEQHEIPYKLVEVKKPTLEALFLHLTGRRLRD